MNCQEALDLLYDIIDKEASEIDEKQVRDHLEKCRDCGEMYRLEESVHKLLEAKVNESCSENCLDQLKSNILTELDSIDRDDLKCEPKSSFSGTIWMMVAAASLIIVVAAAFLTSDLVRHYQIYGPLEQSHIAIQASATSNTSSSELTLAVTSIRELLGFDLEVNVNEYSLVSGGFENLMGADMAHFVYANNGTKVSVFVAPASEFEIPSHLEQSRVFVNNTEFFDHNCRGCRLVFFRSGDSIIVTATTDKSVELLSFIPGHSVI